MRLLAGISSEREQVCVSGLLQSSVTSLPLVYRGKVRDSYALGDDKLLIITTDRLSAFDVVMSQHVQMNVADKRRLYAEARRVLVPGGRLALWDVTAGPSGPLHLPVPWATAAEQSHLVTPERLAELLLDAGFATAHWDDLTQAGENGMRAFLAAPQQALGLHVFVPDFATKAANLVRNLAEDRARLIRAVVTAG